MKKSVSIILATLCLAACSKDPSPALEQTSWEYRTEISNTTYSIWIVLSSPTHGFAQIIQDGNTLLFSGSTQLGYDVKYTFDGNESGTMTFRKEYVETYNTSTPDFSQYVDTITTTFYTYAGNNKMFINTTPCLRLEHIELNKI